MRIVIIGDSGFVGRALCRKLGEKHDEIRCPVHVGDLADSLAECLSLQTAHPVLHIAGPKAVSRYDLARNIALATGYDPEAVPAAKLSESGLIRPRDLTLGNSLTRRLLCTRCRPVHEALNSDAPYINP